MSNDKLLHYKKSYKEYSIQYAHDTLPINFFENKLRNAYYSSKIPKNGFWNGKERKKVNEEVFLNNYGNQRVGIDSNSLTIVIEEIENKISLKVYSTFKNRTVGSTYFRTRKILNFITYNTDSKNLYIGTINKKKVKMINKKLKVNCFYDHSITQLRLYIRRMIRDMVYGTIGKSDDIYSSLIVNTNHGNEESFEVFKVFFNILSNKTNIELNCDSSDLDKEMFKFYLQDNNFKYPDTYSEFSSIPFPKSKLKKYGNIVTLIMSELGLKGKKVREILNQLNDVDIVKVYDLYRMLGVDYFNKLNNSVFVGTETPSYLKLDIIKQRNHNFNKLLNNFDKRRIVNLLNDNTRFSLIMDHLQIIKNLKNYSHDFKMKFTDRDSFNAEHYEVAEIYDSYKKGIITRNYGDLFKEKIEDVIMGTNGVDYHPVLLLTTKDFNEESQHQSNCVRTYIEKSNCVIISLREGSPNGDERATIEYRFHRKEMVRVQSLGKYNKNLTAMYDTPLEILDSRIKELYRKDILHLPSMVKKFKNGKTIERRAHFKEHDSKDLFLETSPMWDNSEDNDENFFDLDLFF